MASIPPNGFGSDTYWNQPTSRRRAQRATRSLSPTNRGPSNNTGPIPNAQSTSQSAGNLSSNAPTSNAAPALSSSNGTILQSSSNVSQTHKTSIRPPSPTVDMSQYRTHMQSLHAENDKKDDAAMVKLMKSKLPLFSNEHDWEMASFELALVLDRVWPHKTALDICHYLQTDYSHFDKDMAKRARQSNLLCSNPSSKKGLICQTPNFGCMPSRSYPVCHAQWRKKIISDVSITVNYDDTPYG